MTVSAASGSGHPSPLVVDQRASVATGTSSTTTANQPHKSSREARTLPPWISHYNPKAGASDEAALHRLTSPPKAVKPEQPNTARDLKRRISKDGYEEWVDHQDEKKSKVPLILRRRADKPGRKWDHLRSAEPVIQGTGYRPAGLDPYAQWRDFLHSTSYGISPGEKHEIIEPEDLQKLQPYLDGPTNMQLPSSHPKARRPSRRKRLKARLWDFLLRHPLVPLLFRLTVLSTSIAALVMSVRIYEIERGQSSEDNDENSRTTAEVAQAIFAMAVDSIAIPYIIGMTWDEFFGKPIGLRSPVQKISLTLLDLLFIIFKSTSTALAFEALVFHSEKNGISLQLSRALAALMLIGLIAWIVNFTISIFRLVARLGGVDDAGGLR